MDRLVKSLSFVLIIIAVGSFFMVAWQQNSQTDEQYLSNPNPLMVTTQGHQVESKSDLLEEKGSISECLACHMDKQQLIDTADPEEEHITENEGQG